MIREDHMKLIDAILKGYSFTYDSDIPGFCNDLVGFDTYLKSVDSDTVLKSIISIQRYLAKTQDIHVDYEFNKVLSEHMDMLDSQRRQQPYPENKMRELVDREYNVLNLLIQSFQKEVVEDQNALVFSLFSLLAMFTVSLRTFDEIYYSNNHEALGDQDVWHMSHEKWMGVFDTLSSKWFVERLQDYGIFEAKLSTREVDIYYTNLMDQVADLREEIEDNQTLLIAMGDMDLFDQFKKMSAKEVADSIKAAYVEAGEGLEESEVQAAYENAMKQVAMV